MRAIASENSWSRFTTARGCTRHWVIEPRKSSNGPLWHDRVTALRERWKTKSRFPTAPSGLGNPSGIPTLRRRGWWRKEKARKYENQTLSVPSSNPLCLTSGVQCNGCPRFAQANLGLKRRAKPLLLFFLLFLTLPIQAQ